MKSNRAVTVMMVGLVWLAGCSNKNNERLTASGVIEQGGWAATKRAWEAIMVGQSTNEEVTAVFKTPVTERDRYAYALDEDKGKNNTFLMMVDLDKDSIVTNKYYWGRATTTAFLAKMESWEMAIETQIPGAILQEYSATMGPREEAILEYFGRELYETASYFDHLNEVFGATGCMKRIFTLAASEYNMRADKQALISEDGFVFDAGIYGSKCTMNLTAIDRRSGWYLIVLRGQRCKNFFSGW